MRLYFDSDGVLADFDAGVEQDLGMSPSDAMDAYGVSAFWEALERLPNFYGFLPLIDGAADLVKAGESLRPLVLTGCPLGNWSQSQKINWAANHFPGLPVICCATKDKVLFCQDGDILIDDSPKNCAAWEDHGGQAIHFENTPQAIADLKKLIG